MRSGGWMSGLVGLTLAACMEQNLQQNLQSETAFPVETVAKGFHPNIVPGENSAADNQILEAWIAETVTLLTSPEFEANLLLASETYPQVWISKARDVIPSRKLIALLHTRDSSIPALWWPRTSVVIKGKRADRSPDRTGFGFDALRTAAAGPYPAGQGRTETGEIELGRLHFARYTQGDAVEKSCAINTMAHEISHTLSDKRGQFWMHILDTGEDARAPRGMYEASYFIGTVAQCTYLESVGRMTPDGFDACLLTFSDPAKGSRFKSRACDDFPDDTPIHPDGRIKP